MTFGRTSKGLCTKWAKRPTTRALKGLKYKRPAKECILADRVEKTRQREGLLTRPRFPTELSTGQIALLQWSPNNNGNSCDDMFTGK
jgi:hypothetical protein